MSAELSSQVHFTTEQLNLIGSRLSAIATLQIPSRDGMLFPPWEEKWEELQSHQGAQISNFLQKIKEALEKGWSVMENPEMKNRVNEILPLAEGVQASERMPVRIFIAYRLAQGKDIDDIRRTVFPEGTDVIRAENLFRYILGERIAV